MTDSYVSSANGDSLTANSTSRANGSSPSLAQPSEASSTPIIRKKLNGYVGFANLPNQVHRKSVRKGFQFTAMVVGKRVVTYCRGTADLAHLIHRRVRSRQIHAH